MLPVLYAASLIALTVFAYCIFATPLWAEHCWMRIWGLVLVRYHRCRTRSTGGQIVLTYRRDSDGMVREILRPGELIPDWARNLAKEGPGLLRPNEDSLSHLQS